MATDIYNAPLGEIRAASTAGGGAALTTTASVTPLIPWTQYLVLTPRNFATAVVAKFALNPWLYVVKTSDNMVSEPVDYSDAAQDGSADTDVVLSSLNTLANGDYVLIGSHTQFRGVQIDVDGTNSTAATTATVKVRTRAGWVDLSATDGTKSATHLDQDGAITWTIPATWFMDSLANIYKNVSYNTEWWGIPLYWVRWEVDKALDSATTLNSVCALNRSTVYGEIVPGQGLEQRVKHGPGGIGCVEHLTNAGTANMVVNCAVLSGGKFR